MDYQEYFDSLIDKNLSREKNEIFRILSSEHQNPVVKNYDGINEVVFELLLALNEENDFTSILELKRLVEKNYEEVFEAECGQFADILIPYYISINQDKEAKSAFEEWYTKEYDYDSMLVILNRLAHFGKENWIDEYILREYDKIKNSPRLISGAEEDLAIYKNMIEVGKLISGTKNLDEVEEELAKYEIILSELYKKGADSDNQTPNFDTGRQEYVFRIISEFQKYLNECYDIPYLTSGVIMNSLSGYYEDSKYNDVITYFKIREKSFENYMYENSVNGLSFNIESNLSMLYILPVFYQYLVEMGIFSEIDRRNETKKIEKLLKKYKFKYKRVSKVFGGLKIYEMITSANKG